MRHKNAPAASGGALPAPAAEPAGPLLTIKEACQYLAVSKASFFRGPRQAIPAVRVGVGQVQFTRAALDDFIREKTDAV